MKSFAFLLLLVNTYSFGQSTVAATTEEEYNYMTKGYRVQIESGLDMKKGYKFEDTDEVQIGNYYKFQLKQLVREARNEVAGVLIITKSSVSGKTYYVAIPHNNKDLFERYNADVKSWDGSLLAAYTLFVSAYLSSALVQGHELEKKPSR